MSGQLSLTIPSAKPFMIAFKDVKKNRNIHDEFVSLGTGSTCQVYEGTFNSQKVAIKEIVLKYSDPLNTEKCRLFYREGELLFRAKHENIVEFLCAAEMLPTSGIDGRLYLVMQLLPRNRTLDEACISERDPTVLTKWLHGIASCNSFSSFYRYYSW